jgi:hypothetical protein
VPPIDRQRHARPRPRGGGRSRSADVRRLTLGVAPGNRGQNAFIQALT